MQSSCNPPRCTGRPLLQPLPWLRANTAPLSIHQLRSTEMDPCAVWPHFQLRSSPIWHNTLTRPNKDCTSFLPSCKPMDIRNPSMIMRKTVYWFWTTWVMFWAFPEHLALPTILVLHENSRRGCGTFSSLWGCGTFTSFWYGDDSSSVSTGDLGGNRQRLLWMRSFGDMNANFGHR